MRRLAFSPVAVVALIALVGCAGKTTGVSKLTDYSATLNSTGRCDSGESCKWYWEYWRADRPRSTSVKTAVAGPVQGPTGDVNLSVNVTGLAANTTYRWVFCGSPNNGSAYGCTGPSAKVGSTTADPPPDSATFTTLTTASLAERWNGSAWTTEFTPNRGFSQTDTLADVSCTSASACVAVGTHANNAGTEQPLDEVWDGTAWKIRAADSAETGNLYGVSCVSATSCTAVGGYRFSQAVIAEHYNGSTWASQRISYPSGAQDIRLSGVSCTSDSACVAVGFYFDTAISSYTALIYRWDGTTWTRQALANPPGTHQQLRGVSCTSATACTAVGDYQRGVGSNGWAMRWNGTSWTTQTTPNPTASGQNRELDAVSCSSATACTAVGYDLDGQTETTAPLVESWNGTSWTVQTVPSTSSGLLQDVSCTSASACTAVGGSVVRWDGTSWKTQPTPIPPSGHGGLQGVSCTSPTACTGVGAQ